jgi:hypothetical protein
LVFSLGFGFGFGLVWIWFWFIWLYFGFILCCDVLHFIWGEASHLIVLFVGFIYFFLKCLINQLFSASIAISDEITFWPNQGF